MYICGSPGAPTRRSAFAIPLGEGPESSHPMSSYTSSIVNLHMSGVTNVKGHWTIGRDTFVLCGVWVASVSFFSLAGVGKGNAGKSAFC